MSKSVGWAVAGFSVIFLLFLYVMFSKKKKEGYKHDDRQGNFRFSEYQINPKDSWFDRADGTGVNIFHPDEETYLLQVIFPNQPDGECPCPEFFGTCRDGQCYSYSNAEIYNNSCCKDGVGEYCAQNPQDPVCLALPIVCEKRGEWQNEKLPCNLTRSPLGDPYAKDLDMYILGGFLNSPYLYAKMDITIKCENLHGGSQGWGFWNTQPEFDKNKTVWFMWQNGFYEDGTPYEMNGFFINVLAGGDNIVIHQLPDLDEEEHDYCIEWTPDFIRFSIDGKVVLIEKDAVPNEPLSFHSWVDNAVFAGKLGVFEHVNHVITEPRSQRIKNLSITQYA